MAGTILVELYGTGAEVSVAKLDQDQYDFWKDNRLNYEEGEVEYDVDEYVFAFDREEFLSENKIPEEAQFLDEYTEWYEMFDQVVHHTGVDYASGVMKIMRYPDVEPDDFDMMKHYESEEVLHENLEIQTCCINSDDEEIENSSEESHLIEVQSWEKGCFGAYVFPNNDFNIEKMSFNVLTLSDGSAIVEHLNYEDEIVDEIGAYETRGKGSYISLIEKGSL
mgnify:CR=1 FL=1